MRSAIDIDRGVSNLAQMSSPRKPQGAPPPDLNGELIATAPVLARWLGVNGKAVYDLAKAGVLVRRSRDQFLLEESVRRYCDYIRKLSKGEAGIDETA